MAILRSAALTLLIAVIINQAPKLFKTKLPVNFGGDVEPGFEKIASVFRANVNNGLEPGAAFAVYYKGKLVVNLWGGYADEEFGIPWRRNTLGHLWSGTKGMGAIMMAMLVHRGQMDYDQPVAKYWPEFAQSGKENVTVRQLLSHQAGLPINDVDFNASMIISDPDGLGNLLAQQKPLWEPGSKFGYHPVTLGLYMDQLIRRIDPKHRSGQQFFAEEIAKPFGIDFFVGIPLEQQWRLARKNNRLESIVNVAMYSPYLAFKQLLAVYGWTNITMRAFGIPVDIHQFAFPENRRIGMIAINGYGTAEAVAKVYSILANGGQVEDQVLLSPEVIQQLATSEVSGRGVILNLPGMSFGPGTLVVPPLEDMGEDYKAFGHFGYGCQAGFAEPNHRIGWSFVTNYVSPLMRCVQEPRYKSLIRALYECVDKLEAKH